MGTLYYGDSRYAIPVDDRVLAHLKIVIVNKLRRSESFTFSWVAPTEDNDESMSTIWLSPSIPLHFEFDTGKTPALNREWLEDLSRAAAGANGLSVTEEPAAPAS